MAKSGTALVRTRMSPLVRRKTRVNALLAPSQATQIRLPARRRIGDAQSPQIDQHGRLQELLRRDRRCALRTIAAAKQRRDPVRHRPDMKRHHQYWGTLIRRHGSDELL